MKILLFGKDGQVGWELQRSLAPLGSLVQLGKAGDGVLGGDFRRPEEIAAAVRAVRPDVIVNASAYTAVDRAESDAEIARLINAVTPSVLAREAAKVGALLVHYSTDYVFDGSGERAWTESDPTGPLSVYGQTKLEGERLVAAHTASHLILRTSWAYAARGSNFAKTILRLAAEKESLTVVNDQFGAPTGAELLADLTAHLVLATRARPELSGLYHVAAAGETSWHGYARFVIEHAAESGHALRAGPEAVFPVPSSYFPALAKRPRNSRLDTSKLRQAFGVYLPPWQDGVRRMLDEIPSSNHGKTT